MSFDVLLEPIDSGIVHRTCLFRDLNTTAVLLMCVRVIPVCLLLSGCESLTYETILIYSSDTNIIQ